MLPLQSKKTVFHLNASFLGVDDITAQQYALMHKRPFYDNLNQKWIQRVFTDPAGPPSLRSGTPSSSFYSKHRLYPTLKVVPINML